MLALILCCTLYFLITGSSSTTSSSRLRTKPQVTKTQEIFLGARTNKAPVKDSLKIESACDELARSLDATDFNLPFDEWIEDIEPGQLESCNDKEVSSRLSSMRKVCFEEINDQACVMEGIFLRSLLRTRGVEDSEDRLQLADLVLREFAMGNPDFGKLMNFSDKLMDLNPDQLAFHKLWAMSKVIHALEQKVSPAEYAQEIENRVDPRIWEDQETIGLDLALKSGFEPSSVEEIAREMLSQKDDPRVHEILGWSLWKQNRRAEAIDQLKVALKMNPQDAWLKEQYKKVMAKEAGENDFQARFSLGFDLRDLFQ